MKKFLLLFLALPSLALAEYGEPFMTRYPVKETGGHTQNWDIIQDDRGIMYIGNGYGVQEFDGSSWRVIFSPNKSLARSLAKDDKGRIYVGFSSDFGYLAPDEQGTMQFTSLLDQVVPADRVFNYVNTTMVTPEGIYFQASERLFRFRPRSGSNPLAHKQEWEVKSWAPKNFYTRGFWLDGSYTIFETGVGLLRMQKDSLVVVPGSEKLAGHRLIFMLPFRDKPGVLLAGSGQGLFVWDGHDLHPFRCEAEEIHSATPYHAIVLPDGSFAIGTLTRGFYIIDQTGKTRLHLDMSSGLSANTVGVVFLDRQQNIWLGVDGAVTVVEYNSPLSRFKTTFGGGTNEFCRHQGLLYISANEGLYYLDPDDGVIKPLTGAFNQDQCLALAKIHDELFAATGSGIIRISNRQGFLDLPTSISYSSINDLMQSKLAGTYCFASQLDGLSLLRYNPAGATRLTLIKKIPNLHDYIWSMIEPEPGVLWCGSLNAGALRITYTASLDDFRIERFGTDEGLPAGGVTVFKLSDRVVFSTKEGIYKYDEAARRFVRDPFFEQVGVGLNADETAMTTDHKGNIWANLGKESVVFVKEADGSFTLHTDELARFAEDPAITIYPEENGQVWFGTSTEVIRYFPGVKAGENVALKTLIRRVVVNRDSMIYNGAGVGDITAGYFPHNLNSLRFDFAVPSYVATHSTEFQSMLEGFDESWSEWTREHRRNYTNLPAGHYCFRVRARTIDGRESTPGGYSFAISAPWYASWWARPIYLILLGGLIFLVSNLRTRALRKESAALELIIAERTAEIKAAQETLVTQSKLAALGALTAGIAHEIKNPLNFVNNFAQLSRTLVQELKEELEREPQDKTAIEEIMLTLAQNSGKIEEHGKRADSIVRSMLQHSRGTAGERHPTDLNAMLDEDINLAYHGMRAQDAGFNARIEKDLDPAVGTLNIVPQDVSRVFLNIISNGFYEVHRKKTALGGDYAPTLTITSRNLGDRVEVRIRDNGGGIPKKISEKLFTPFFTTKPPGKGTGLGLSISYDIIVQQHGGQLTFDTREGEFTEFIIRLPK